MKNQSLRMMDALLFDDYLSEIIIKFEDICYD